jgi:transcriptional regulator with XRE-family HTH domain
MVMSLRENLAVNLRRLCAERGSIAAVCREMGVNRQQFDRYLSMDALPNRATTARICEYFGVEEADLYRDPDAGSDGDRPKLTRFRGQEGPIAARIFAPPQPTIPPGFYQTFFSIPDISDQVICSLTAIRVDGERTTFRRLTGLAEGRGTTWSYYMGDHEGVVLERLNWFYFLGLNRRGPREPTTMAVQWGPFSEPMLVGHAMIVTPSGPSVTTVAMRGVPKGVSLRKALREAHVYSTSDPLVGPLVESALKKRYMAVPPL